MPLFLQNSSALPSAAGARAASSRLNGAVASALTLLHAAATAAHAQGALASLHAIHAAAAAATRGRGHHAISSQCELPEVPSSF